MQNQINKSYTARPVRQRKRTGGEGAEGSRIIIYIHRTINRIPFNFFLIKFWN